MAKDLISVWRSKLPLAKPFHVKWIAYYVVGALAIVCGLTSCDPSQTAQVDKTEQVDNAAQSGDLAKVKALLKGEPDLIFSRAKEPDPYTPDIGGWTPLHFATANGHVEVVKYLLANKASIDATDDYGETALFLAAYHGQTAAAELLIASNADISESTSGERPLEEAAFRGDTELVKTLLTKNVDVNAKDMQGTTALDQAAGEGHKEIVELLLANKAHMDQWTLNYAVLGMHDDVAELLLKNGADVNARETNGQTPLLVLTDSDSNAYGTPDVDFLLTNKANINARDNQGNTALHYAALYGHADIVKLLLARGASADATNLNGQTPLDLAKTNTDDAFFPNQKYHDVMALLLQHGARE